MCIEHSLADFSDKIFLQESNGADCWQNETLINDDCLFLFSQTNAAPRMPRIGTRPHQNNQYLFSLMLNYIFLQIK